MFQSFDVTSDPASGPARVAALRARMKNAGVSGFLIPRADAFQGEYVADCDARLKWLTGFTGSAGFAVVLQDKAGVFIDGRYRLQVLDQVSLDTFTPVHWPEVKLADWLIETGATGAIGFDPWLHAQAEIDRTTAALTGHDITLRPVENLVDAIWADRPARPNAKAFAHDLAHAGESHEAKRARLAASLRQAKQVAAIITQSDSIAWLLNIRGADIPHNPIVQAFVILHETGAVDLFCDPAKLIDVADHLGPDIAIKPFADFEAALAFAPGTRVAVDGNSVPVAVVTALKAAGAEPVFSGDPCVMPKAIKNATEIAGARDAHLIDGAAVVEFLAAFHAQLAENGPADITEIDIVTDLETRRQATNQLREISFETIAGSGPNGALMHYRVSTATNRTLKTGDLLVLDSGAQYVEGTTDITRTLAIGTPGADEVAAFTRVLQGMIAISRARFPRGVGGAHLDALARAPLWMAGQDYDHGTGHGVGSYLCVHEGPARISRVSDIPLQPGMILSNEPGYYRPGAFGIRIENLIVVRKAAPMAGGDARDMLDFEQLTFVPIARDLIDVSMLSAPERAWVDAYHAEVLAKIGPRVSQTARAWLASACAPL